MTLEGDFIQTYKTAEIAEILGVGASTVRNYALNIEKQGGLITRDAKGDRIYTTNELQAFKRLREIIAAGNTVTYAAAKVAALLNDEKEVRQQAGHTLAASDGALLREALDEIKALRAEVAELKAEQSAERIKEREAFRLALNEMKNSHETEIKLLSEQVDAEEVAEDKPGLFARLFGKRK